MVVRVLQEAGVHLHLAREHRLEIVDEISSQAGISARRAVNSASGMTTSCFSRRTSPRAERSHPWSNLSWSCADQLQRVLDAARSSAPRPKSTKKNGSRASRQLLLGIFHSIA